MIKNIKVKKPVLLGLSFLASLCFFIVYIKRRDTLEFILGCLWFCIGISQLEKNSK